MAWKASRATVAAIAPTKAGWPAYPMPRLIGPRKARTRPAKSADVVPTMRRMVENTCLGSSPSLFANRKNVVSIP